MMTMAYDHAYRDPEFLKRAYWVRGQSIEAIAHSCGVSAPTVKKYMRRGGIPTRPKGEQSTITFEKIKLELNELFVKLGHVPSFREVDENASFCAGTVYNKVDCDSWTTAMKVLIDDHN
jgi:hypothetical protein